MENSKTLAITYFNDGNKVYNAKLFDDALKLFQQSVDLDPTFFDAHFCLAKTHLRLQHSEEGIRHFKKYYHLIPAHQSLPYVKAFSSILFEENQIQEAIDLLVAQKDHLDDEALLKLMKYLFIKGRENEAYQILFGFKPSKLQEVYQKFLSDLSLPPFIKSTIEQDQIVVDWIAMLNKEKWINHLDWQEDNYQRLHTSIKEEIGKPKRDKANYRESLNTIHANIEEISSLLVAKMEEKLVAKELYQLDSFMDTLQRISNEGSYTHLKKQVDAFKKTNTSKNLKIIAVVVSVVVVLILSGYLLAHYLKKQKAYDKALELNNVEAYTDYLNAYGSNEEIHRLREDKMYQNALQQNTSYSINQLQELYSNSKYLRKIYVKGDGTTKVQIRMFGTRGEPYDIVNKDSKNEFLLPIGCTVGYSLTAEGMLPITRYIKVHDALTIHEAMILEKEIVYREEFESNANKWEEKETFTSDFFNNNILEMKIKVDGGRYYYENNKRENEFLYSVNTIKGFNSNDDYEILTSIETTSKQSNGVFLLFGYGTRAFLYFGYMGRQSYGEFLIGKNDWDNPSDNWIKWNNTWQRGGNGYMATLKVRKFNGLFSFYIDDIFQFEHAYEKEYGSKIGFGVNNSSLAYIHNLEVYKLNKIPVEKKVKGQVYYCQDDDLNVREVGDVKGKPIGSIQRGTPVLFLGETSEKEAHATFNGIDFNDFYYKVELLDGSIGWVHGGALQSIPNIPSDWNKIKTNLKQK